MNTIYTTTQGTYVRRAIERMKTEPIFDSNVIDSLACSALRYRCDTQGEDAMRFAIGLAGLAYSDRASEEAWA